MDRSTFGLDAAELTENSWSVPADVVAAVVFVAVADVVVLAATTVTALRTAFALPLVAFVPGYLVVASLFPRRYDDTDPLVADERNLSPAGVRRAIGARSVTPVERLALSLGLSLALVPVVALVVAPLAGSLSTRPVVAALTAVVAGGAVVATLRRNAVPAQERFTLPARRWATVLREDVLGSGSRLDRAVAALLVFTVFAAAVTFGFGLVAPQSGEAYTGVTLVADGAGTADYPTTLTRGESTPLALTVENHEGAATTYTVVTQLQRVDTAGESQTVTESRELAVHQATVGPGETWTATDAVTPSLTGENLRLTYLVYRGEAPAEPRRANAYRNAYLWVDVEPAG